MVQRHDRGVRSEPRTGLSRREKEVGRQEAKQKKTSLKASKKDSLRNFTQRPPLLPEVRDHTDATALSATNAFLDGVGEVGLAGTDVRAEDVGAIACRVWLVSKVKEENGEDEMDEER